MAKGGEYERYQAWRDLQRLNEWARCCPLEYRKVKVGADELARILLRNAGMTIEQWRAERERMRQCEYETVRTATS